LPVLNNEWLAGQILSSVNPQDFTCFAGYANDITRATDEVIKRLDINPDESAFPQPVREFSLEATSQEFTVNGFAYDCTPKEPTP